jgi:hypothetical protein
MTTPTSNISTIKDWVQTAAILIAGIWALFIFKDTLTRQDELYRGRAAAIVPSCVVEVLGESGDFYLLRSTVKVTSASKIKLHIFDSAYIIRGMVIAPTPHAVPLDEIFATATQKLTSGKRFAYAPRYGDPNGLPIEVGRLWAPTDSLEPNETVQDERVFLISKKSAELFDWVSIVIDLVLGEDIAKLGHEVKFNSDGSIVSNLLVYERPKKNEYAYSESGNVATLVPNDETDSVARKRLLQSSNVASAFAVCNVVLPNKRLVPARTP